MAGGKITLHVPNRVNKCYSRMHSSTGVLSHSPFVQVDSCTCRVADPQVYPSSQVSVHVLPSLLLSVQETCPLISVVIAGSHVAGVASTEEK